MKIDFEVFGEITNAETIAIGPSIRELGELRARLDMDVGESEKGLPTCVSVVVKRVLEADD